MATKKPKEKTPFTLADEAVFKSFNAMLNSLRKKYPARANIAVSYLVFNHAVHACFDDDWTVEELQEDVDCD